VFQMQGGIGQIWQALITQLKADRRKAIALGVLVLVMALLYGRLLLRRGSSASEAAAATPAPVAQGGPAPSQPVAPPITKSAAPRVEPAKENLPARRSISIETMSRDMTRNLFETDWTAFPPTAESMARSRQTHAAATQPVAVAEWWQRLQSHWAEQRLKAQEVRQKLEEEASEFELQGTLLSEPPRACISGRTIRCGDIIGGFRLVRVNAREVTLQKSGQYVRLTMP